MSGRATRSGGAVFLDTHGLLAALNADDAHHDAAIRWIESFVRDDRRVFTSDWVLGEFLSIASRRPLRAGAVKVVESLKASARTTIVEAVRQDWDRAYRLFRSRRDKEWSFVDCTSMILCEDLEIGEVLTHDHHFRQAGPRPLL